MGGIFDIRSSAMSEPSTAPTVTVIAASESV